MPAFLFEHSFDPLHELAQFQNEQLRAGSYGACANFIGTMRDFNADSDISQMTLEHYPGMTQQYLNQLCEQTKSNSELLDCLIIHRFGDIKPGDPIVLTAAWAAHREDAFAACRHMIEELKKHAPFWKKETTEQGERWVHEAPAK